MDFLLTLLLLPFAVPLALGFVTMCCCGTPSSSGCTIVCNAGTKPVNITVVMTGIVNKDCANCATFNQTWIVVQGSACSGSSASDSTTCVGATVSVTSALGIQDGTNSSLQLVLDMGALLSQKVTWRNTNLNGAAPIDCKVGTKTLPLFSDSGASGVSCGSDGSSITAELV